MVLFKKLWVLPALFFIFSGCRKPTGANWDVDVVLPVVNSTLNIKNFIADSIFKADNNGLLYLSINREIASIMLDSLLSVPDTVINPPPFYSPGTLVLQPGEGIPAIFIPPTELNFDAGDGVAIKRIDVRSCKISVKFSNNVPQPLDFEYSIPNATKFGLPFKITETVPTGTNSLVKEYDLSGYSLKTTGATGNKYNSIVQTYALRVNPLAPGAVTVNASQGIAISVAYSKIIPDYIEGYFGNRVVDIGPDTAAINLIDNFRADNFMLSDAQMNFKIENALGVDFSADLSNLRSINTLNNTNILLNTTKFSNLNIDAAKKSGSTLTSKGTRTIAINPSNSNVTAFISNFPDKLTYQGKIQLNPKGNLSSYNDFAFYNTGVKIIADISIPMRFTANYFQLKSNASVDFANVEQLDKVNAGNFVIQAANGYPFDAKLQAYMLDANNAIIDSLFNSSSNTIGRGQLNSANEVTAPTRSRILVPINQNKIANLRRAKTIRVSSLFIMPPNPPEIKLLESYQIDVNIIAELNYNVGIQN